MEKIKYRGWHTKLNKMFSAEEMGEDQLTLMTDGRGFVNVSGVSTKLSRFLGDQMIPMQFTGIVDKNGKEIYFGDILDYEDVDTDKGNHKIAEVTRTICNGAGVLIDYQISDLWEDETVHVFEVIGNIYENPELLK